MERFRYRRRVGFGECDPARIFYAPRAVDYAAEAVEAWCEAALGISWADLALRSAREVRVLVVDCEYRRSLRAGEVIEVAVEVEDVGAETFNVSATAERAPGEVTFHATLVLAVAERGGARPLPLPAEWVTRLAAHARAKAAPGNAPRAPAGRGHVPAAAAFTRERRVRYGDCGPSGDAYAPRVAEWAVEAVGEWYEAQLGISWLEQCLRGRGTPFLRIRCAYLDRMEPGRLLTLAVSIPRLGNASIDYHVAGRDERGAPCFEAEMSACHISEEGGRPRAMPFPDDLRARILAYQRATGAAPGS